MLKETQTYTQTQKLKKTIMSIKRVTYQIKLALYYTDNLVVKHNFYVDFSSNPSHLNPWIDSIIVLTSDKLQKQFWRFHYKDCFKPNVTPLKITPLHTHTPHTYTQNFVVHMMKLSTHYTSLYHCQSEWSNYHHTQSITKLRLL